MDIGTRPGLHYRGSRRRVRRIHFRGNWSKGMWLFVAWLTILLFVVVPYLLRHPPESEAWTPHASMHQR